MKRLSLLLVVVFAGMSAACMDPGQRQAGVDDDDSALGDDDTSADDDDATAYPDAEEVWDDGIDQDCDGVDILECFEDGDGDGYGIGGNHFTHTQCGARWRINFMAVVCFNNFNVDIVT